MRRPRLVDGEMVAFVSLVLAVLFVATASSMFTDSESAYPFTALAAPLLLGVVLLGSRKLSLFIGYLLVVLAALAVVQDFTVRLAIGLAFDVVLCVIVLWFSLRGRAIGYTGRRGASMLVDLRDRILAQGEIPVLPDAWLVESALSSAGGSPFAGDFIVATASEDGRRLSVAVVDVSGKGEAAGIRALQLSGALGGLLAALPPADFLPAANSYLLQRFWEEGFATAVHLSLDLVDGSFEARTAGHPPVVHRHAGSGRWQVLPSEGPILGFIDDVAYEPVVGRMHAGDTLLLYTDGMVEKPRRDIELGIDAMMGEAESLLRGSWDGMAARLTAAVGSPDDDRALLLVHRR